MKLGVFCVSIGVTSLVITVWMIANGTVFLRGFVVSIALSLFGLYLIHKAQRLRAIKQWAREHPDEAKQWLDTFEEANNARK